MEAVCSGVVTVKLSLAPSFMTYQPPGTLNCTENIFWIYIQAVRKIGTNMSTSFDFVLKASPFIL